MHSILESRSLLSEFCSEIIVFSNQIKKAGFNASGVESILSVGQAVLELLEERGPMTVPAIASERSSSRQNVQIMVNRLGRFGFVEVRANPHHKRSSLVTITDKGKSALQRATQQQAAALEARLSPHYSDKELARSLELISRLRHALDADDLSERKQARGEGRKDAPAATTSSSEGAIPNENLGASTSPLDAAPPDVSEVDENSLPYNLL